jgi:hypothetical protein
MKKSQPKHDLAAIKHILVLFNNKIGITEILAEVEEELYKRF